MTKKNNYPLIHLNETVSTNQYLQELCQKDEKSVEELTCVLADYQTAGKGQRGNSWEAAAGCNLLFSFVLYPLFVDVRKQFILSQIISLSIKEALSTYTSDISIKWPNDIYWKDKKICGILIENMLQGKHIARCVIGCGININQERFVSDAPNPVSLYQIIGEKLSPIEILNDIMNRVITYYKALQTDVKNGAMNAVEFIMQRYMHSLYRADGFHTYQDSIGKFQGKIIRVESDGHLILCDESNLERAYMFKEVKFIINELVL